MDPVIILSLLVSGEPTTTSLKPPHMPPATKVEWAARFQISSFTHVEVPSSKVAEVTILLKQHGHSGLPVFAFEQCEQLHASKHFSALVG